MERAFEVEFRKTRRKVYLAYASDDNTALELGIEMYESGDFCNFEDASVTTDVCGIEKEIEYFFLTLFDQNRN